MSSTAGRTIGYPPPSGGEDFRVRKALMTDLSEVLRLINGYAAQGIMLPRTEFEMAENLRDFSVVDCSGAIAGVGALHFYTPDSGEIRSLAVEPKWQKHGVGKRIIQALEEEAREFGLQAVFAFTYVDRFFEKLGYTRIDRSDLPLKAWKDCLRCPKFQCCDELAVIKQLGSAHIGVSDTRTSGVALSPRNTPQPASHLPILGQLR